MSEVNGSNQIPHPKNYLKLIKEAISALTISFWSVNQNSISWGLS
jgi:hypothetical protein